VVWFQSNWYFLLRLRQAIDKGTHIGFAGAVYTDGPNVEVLSLMLPLCILEMDVELRTIMARHVGALKKAVASLAQYYTQEVLDKTRSLPDVQFPYHCWYMTLEGSHKVGFKYMSQIGDKLVFQVRTESKEEVCVKFMHQYSLKVHLICMLSGFVLRVRGFEQ